MRKKICLIGFLKMGIGHYIAHLYKELNKEYDLEVISYTHGAIGDKLVVDDIIIKEQVKKYQQVLNPHSFKTAYKSIETLFEIFEKNKYDILNIHVSAYTRLTSYFFIPLIDYFKNKGLKIVFSIHDVLPFPEGGKISSYLQYFYSLADVAIVGNKLEEENLKKIFHYRKRIYVATHGIYSLFNRKLKPEKAIQKLGLLNQKNKLLFFGILRENKGLSDLIKALALLQTQNFRDFVCIIAVSLRSQIKFDIYQRLIEKNKLDNKVKIYIKDESTIDEIETFFKAVDLVILPYTQASQSGILNLALAFEKPVILSSLFVESNEFNNKIGLVVKPSNPYDLALKIKYFLDNKNTLTKFFQKNIQRYNLQHSFRQTAEIYKKVFNSLLSSDDKNINRWTDNQT